jgi:hypothetical protein
MKLLHVFPLFLLSALYAGIVRGQDIEWPYDDYYTEYKLYVYAIANYDLHPTWHEKWENNLFRQNMLRLNYGSISNTELLSDARLVINEKVAPGIWFRYATTYYATHHRNEQDKYFTVGFEKNIFKGFSLFVYGNPHFEKEGIDIFYGVSLANKQRSNYMRAALVDVDPFWNDKNNVNSYNLKRPWQISWEANYRLGRFRFFSQGRYDSGTERLFEVEPAATNFDQQRKKSDDMMFKLYFYRNENSIFELSSAYYNFQEAKRYSFPLYDFDYRNRIDSYKLSYITPLRDRYRLRLGSFYIRQRASSRGYKSHDYKRQEFIPYVFGEMFAGPGIIEFGYMLSKYQWDYVAPRPIDDDTSDDYIDKIKLAYTLNLQDRAYLQFSLSHVTTIWGFGGGNVQFWMTF